MQDGKHVILCIDDDPSIIDWMENVLGAEGFIIVCASCAEDGLKKFKEVNPDFIIVDLMMEEIDSGTTFVKDLKALGSEAPIFMLSAAGDELNMTMDYTALGLDGVFQKPMQKEALLPVIKAKLGLSS